MQPPCPVDGIQQASLRREQQACLHKNSALRRRQMLSVLTLETLHPVQSHLLPLTSAAGRLVLGAASPDRHCSRGARAPRQRHSASEPTALLLFSLRQAPYKHAPGSPSGGQACCDTDPCHSWVGTRAPALFSTHLHNITLCVWPDVQKVSSAVLEYAVWLQWPGCVQE